MSLPYPPRFVADESALDEALEGAKLVACPHCRRTGTLVGHGLLKGYAQHGSARAVRGRRLLCSNRFRRPGCGRTWPVRIAHVLRGFVVRTPTLSELLRRVTDGDSLRAAWQRTPSGLVLRSAYRLWRRLLHAQSPLRTWLLRMAPPPVTADHRPHAQLLRHLQAVFPEAHCELASYQNAAQRSVFA